jgi:hypothetical protein
LIGFATSLVEILVATFTSLLLGLIVATRAKPSSSYLPAFALGVTLWLFVDTSNDALLFDVNSGFSGGWEQVTLVGLLATGLLALLLIEYFRARGRLDTQGTGDAAYLLAILAALGIGFHALGEGEAFGSLASSTASGSMIAALGGYGPGIGYVLHKLLEGVVIGAVFRAYSAPADQSRGNTFGKLIVLGGVGSALTLVGDAVGYFGPINASFFFALGACSTIYIMVRLALPMISTKEIYERHGAGLLALLILLGFLSVYFAGLFHSVALP